MLDHPASDKAPFGQAVRAPISSVGQDAPAAGPPTGSPARTSAGVPSWAAGTVPTTPHASERSTSWPGASGADAASARSILAKMFEMCFSTAPPLTTRVCAMAALLRPSAIRARTSRE